MTIKNRRKHAKKELLRNRSLVERMKEAQLAHDIAMFKLQQASYIQ